jgi:hypothetical protein
MDTFGLEAFAEFAERQGTSLNRVATLAAHYYLGDADYREPAWQPPKSRRNAEGDRREPGARIELDRATWDALLHEARRQGVDIGVLAAHAILYFMTDVYSGRVAQRMAHAVVEPRRA